MFSPDIRSSQRSLASPFFGLIAAALLFSAAPSFFAQTKDHGNAWRGHVTDVAGAALPDASVTLSNLMTGLERMTVTDANSNFAAKFFRHDAGDVRHDRFGLRWTRTQECR